MIKDDKRECAKVDPIHISTHTHTHTLVSLYIEIGKCKKRLNNHLWSPANIERKNPKSKKIEKKRQKTNDTTHTHTKKVSVNWQIPSDVRLFLVQKNKSRTNKNLKLFFHFKIVTTKYDPFFPKVKLL